MINGNDYNSPLINPEGYFYGKVIPPFADYLSQYHVHFMRYLYFLCIMNAEGDYPVNKSIESIQQAFDNGSGSIKPPINRILICEAPPPNPLNYFYNPLSPWTSVGRPGPGGAAFTGAIQTALFPGITFTTKIDFLKECARKGFLLLDLFPYAITYTGRTSLKYTNACINAWVAGPSTTTLDILNYLKRFIQKDFAIGFALTSFGRIILTAAPAIGGFNTWCVANGFILNPAGALDQIRTIPSPYPTASNYLRICHRRPMFGPCPTLLNLAGF